MEQLTEQLTEQQVAGRKQNEYGCSADFPVESAIDRSRGTVGSAVEGGAAQFAKIHGKVLWKAPRRTFDVRQPGTLPIFAAVFSFGAR